MLKSLTQNPIGTSVLFVSLVVRRFPTTLEAIRRHAVMRKFPLLQSPLSRLIFVGIIPPLRRPLRIPEQQIDCCALRLTPVSSESPSLSGGPRGGLLVSRVLYPAVRAPIDQMRLAVFTTRISDMRL